MKTLTLFRPVGLAEMGLIFDSGMRRFPPRLAHQPIFYPVLNAGYAAQIAREWNTNEPTRAGFVTRFEVEAGYAARFERRIVGGREHEELWVPAEELGAFNAKICGEIEVLEAFYGEGYTGAPPQEGIRDAPDADAYLERLEEISAYSLWDLELLIAMNRRSIYLNFAYWWRRSHGDAWLGPCLEAIAHLWAKHGQPRLFVIPDGAIVSDGAP